MTSDSKRDQVEIERELMRGAAPLAVLHLLSRRPMYGYELARELGRASSGALELGHSTLYPMLYNLESKGLVEARESESESGRVRRYYHLTPAGERALGSQQAQWRKLVRGMRALGLVESPA